MTDAEFDALISERKCRKCGEEYEGEHVCKSVKDKAQTFALNTWLSDYPSDMTYEQIIECLDKDVWTDYDEGWASAGIVFNFVVQEHYGQSVALLISETFKRAMGLYCGGECPAHNGSACDGYLGDIDGLYAADDLLEDV